MNATHPKETNSESQPSLLTDCSCSLPITKLKNCIRFSQFFVFPKPDQAKPVYLNLKLPAPDILGSSVEEAVKAATDEVLKQMQDALEQAQSFFGFFGVGRSVRRDLRRKSGLVGSLRLRQPDSLEQFHNQRPMLREQVITALTNKFAPGEYSSWVAKHPLVGICAIYEQCWEVLGYTRGELVSSISLAPGEQVVLEYHTWDKSTFKSEEELTQELELRLTSKLTRRDSQELVGELSTQTGAKLSEQLNLTIPIPLGDIVIPLGVNVGAELSQQINTKITGTSASVTERTEEAAATLKNQHKVRVEIARETGREAKQTRTVANTNRCHTLNCHYFEILSNYQLRTRLKRLAPCVLVDIPKMQVTRPWVLCHEGILRKVLIDPVYLPGFAAARLLEIAEALQSLSVPPSQSDAGAPTGGPDVGPFNSLRRAILDAWEDLEEAVDEMTDAVGTLVALNLDFGAKVQAARDLVDTIRKGFYLALLAANSDAYNAVRALETTKESVNAFDALQGMFASVTHRDYQYTVVKSVLAEGLDALGLPEEVVDFLLTVGNLSPILGITSLAELVADDAGLHVAVKAAEDRVKQATGSPAGTVAVGLADASGIAPGLIAGGQQEEGIALLKLARAQVEFARLKCHINDYKSHYLQAIWLLTHPDERSRFLAERGLSNFTTGELLGFVDDKAAYALSDPTSFLGVADMHKFIKEIMETLKAQTELTIQLPTGGTVMEAFVGCCDSCEDFIDHSRDIELRMNTAKAAQEEAEAERRRARLALDPADLNEFVSPPGGSLNVEIQGPSDTGDGT